MLQTKGGDDGYYHGSSEDPNAGQICQTFDIVDPFSLMASYCCELFKGRDRTAFFSIYHNFKSSAVGPHKYLPTE